MNVKGAFDEVPDRDSKQFVGHQKKKKTDPYCKVAENLAKLFSTIGRKMELVSEKLS